MDLYNGYCATANVAAAVQTTAPSVTASNSATSTPVANSPNTSLEAHANESSTTSTPSTTGIPEPGSLSDTSEKKGLAQSDIIALAVGLDVGVPSLLLALATFCVTKRRKERQNRVTTEILYVN
ncbi:hypothetical protein BKA64DRAFT_88684 [Cadophora sp. MPI-SDFR-AT-0126]|nr:hypothetical protein BKA64DRAFT_88684 [Leotiomycetes sp. MPI-SDFR-AT-0126]